MVASAERIQKAETSPWSGSPASSAFSLRWGMKTHQLNTYSNVEIVLSDLMMVLMTTSAAPMPTRAVRQSALHSVLAATDSRSTHKDRQAELGSRDIYVT